MTRRTRNTAAAVRHARRRPPPRSRLRRRGTADTSAEPRLAVPRHRHRHAAATMVSRPRSVGRRRLRLGRLAAVDGRCVLRSARRCPLRGLTAAAAALPCQPPPSVPTSVRRTRSPQTDPRDMRVVCAYAPRKLRPYGAIQICLLLLLLYVDRKLSSSSVPCRRYVAGACGRWLFSGLTRF